MPDLAPHAVAAEFRRQMPVHQQWTYLDHAAVAPITQPAAEVDASEGDRGQHHEGHSPAFRPG